MKHTLTPQENKKEKHIKRAVFPMNMCYQENCGKCLTCKNQTTTKEKKCFRCGAKANQTWNICADGNKDRWVCKKCDIALNTIVLIFMGFKNWKSKIKNYD